MSVFARAMSLGAILIMLAAYTAPAKAQEQPQAVHGIIFDSEGNPLVGATVVVAGGVQGTTTDTKGKFTLKVKPSDSLTFSYLGYTSQTTKVGSRTKFNIRLEKDASTDIEEVVVIGYGQVAKKDLTGSVSTVKMNDIKDLPTPRSTTHCRDVSPAPTSCRPPANRAPPRPSVSAARVRSTRRTNR